VRRRAHFVCDTGDDGLANTVRGTGTPSSAPWQSIQETGTGLDQNSIGPRALQVINAKIVNPSSTGSFLMLTCGQVPTDVTGYGYDFGQGNFTGFRLFTYYETNSPGVRVDSFIFEP
jgi:hypothetical protein